VLTDAQIEAAKAKEASLIAGQPASDLVIMAAFEGLDAQPRIKSPSSKSRPLKHIIENWAGCYVSMADVKIAAWLHPDITGEYPRFNIAFSMTRPSAARLQNIGQGDAHERWPEWPQTGEAYEYSTKEEAD